MTAADRIEKVQQLIDKSGTSSDSPIVQLLEICKDQQEHIDTLIEQVVNLQANGGNTAARVSHLEKKNK